MLNLALAVLLTATALSGLLVAAPATDQSRVLVRGSEPPALPTLAADFADVPEADGGPCPIFRAAADPGVPERSN